MVGQTIGLVVVATLGVLLLLQVLSAEESSDCGLALAGAYPVPAGQTTACSGGPGRTGSNVGIVCGFIMPGGEFGEQSLDLNWCDACRCRRFEVILIGITSQAQIPLRIEPGDEDPERDRPEPTEPEPTGK